MSDKNQVQQPARDAFIIGYTGREGLDWRRLKLPKKFPRTSVSLRRTKEEPPSSAKPRA